MQYLHSAERAQQPRIVSIQNPYNLLNRTFEVGLAEIACREQVGLLAYSPLGFGVLSGKYLHGQKPPGARLFLILSTSHATRIRRGLKPPAVMSGLQEMPGIDPAVMALAYVNSRDFVTSNIIGATSMEQLKKNISSIDTTLPEDVITAIEKVHETIPNPVSLSCLLPADQHLSNTQ